MSTTFKMMLCRVLAVAMLLLPFHTGQAAMIGADQVNAVSAAQQVASAERVLVVDFLNRAQTVSEFQSLGLDHQSAVQRVAAMSDAEVATLAGKINAMPAGADGLVLLILVVFFIWYFAFRR
jgi:hypothetical protein